MTVLAPAREPATMEPTEKPQASSGLERRLWTVAEFEHLINLGVFASDERLELIEGELVKKMTQNSPHATAILLTAQVLQTAFASGHHVRVQMPLVLTRHSRPEPDVCVVPGAIRDYAQSNPTTAVLVVEVSDSTLADDRAGKASLYARAGIAEYWIVNLPDHVLEVYRDPAPMTGQPFDHGYRAFRAYSDTESLSPHAVAETMITVAGLLP